jgi:prepilin-type N-terminal cleavage/methylation domain-containing protein
MGRKLTPSDAGVTLIELLVVVAVLAVLAVGVSITTMRGSGDGAQSDIAWFQSQFEQHRALAITSASSFGMIANPKELRITQHQSGGWAPQESARRWRDRMVFSSRSPKTNFNAPDIVMLASGQSTAFEITFGTAHTCITDGWGPLTCNSK